MSRLTIEYCRLFVGPRDHLPPFQSVWQSGQFQSAATASMKSFVEVVGYELESRSRGIMLDHLGVQLDVMGCILGEAATSQGDAQQLSQVMELADSFFARHLRWPDELLDAAQQRAETDFYRSLAILTREFLCSEMPA